MPVDQPPTYISMLDVRPEETAKLRQLGADTPQQLLAQIEAGWAAFVRYVGMETAQRVERALREMVTPDHPTHPVVGPGQLGVPLEAGPTDIPAPKVDLARRNELFDLIQRLKAERAPIQQVESAERELDALFERSRN